MVVRPQGRRGAIAVFALVAAVAVVRGGALGFAIAALAAAGIVWVLRQRLTADGRGVTVVNVVRVLRVPWLEINDFRLRRMRPVMATCLEIDRHDGRPVRSWAVMTGTLYGGFSRARVNTILADLRRRHAFALGISPSLVDARALDDALAAAEGGDFTPLQSFVLEERGDFRAVQERLRTLTSEGRIDLEALGARHEAPDTAGERTARSSHNSVS
jgi:Bacterial PH domain